MVNSPLIRPYLLGGWHRGGVPLDSHDFCLLAVLGYQPEPFAHGKPRSQHGTSHVPQHAGRWDPEPIVINGVRTQINGLIIGYLGL